MWSIKAHGKMISSLYNWLFFVLLVAKSEIEMETGRWCFACEAWICNQPQFHSDDYHNFWEAHHLSAAHKIAAEKYTGPTEGEWDGVTIAATLLGMLRAYGWPVFTTIGDLWLVIKTIPL
jgi:hypothetical protein